MRGVLIPPLKRSFIRFPIRVEFGCGKLKELGTIAAEFGKRAYVLFDPFFQNSEPARQVLDSLHAAGIEAVACYGIQPNPRAADMDRKAAECVEQRCDFMIALGGGAMDIGKAVAMVATNGRSA